jgi:hypothetical protein
VTGSASELAALVPAFEAWDQAERAALMFPTFRGQRIKADLLHDALYQAALLAGFEPFGFDAKTSLEAWAVTKVAVIRRLLPRHVAEATAASKEA